MRGPTSDVIPATTDCSTHTTENATLAYCGWTEPSSYATSTPASEPIAPEMANPVSFVRTGWMPYAAETISESRIARKARPVRVLFTRHAKRNAIAVQARNT